MSKRSKSAIAQEKMQAMLAEKERFEEQLRQERLERNRSIKELERQVKALRKQEFEDASDAIGEELLDLVGVTEAEEVEAVLERLLRDDVVKAVTNAVEKFRESNTEEDEESDEEESESTTETTEQTWTGPAHSFY